MQEHVFTLHSNKPVKITVLAILWAISASNIFSKKKTKKKNKKKRKKREREREKKTNK